MTIPKGYEEENKENITLYHYVEILVNNYRNYIKNNSYDYDFTLDQAKFIVKLYQEEVMTQQDLARFFDKTEGYTAKVLNQFQQKGLINRQENPDNHRQKLVRLTDKGLEQAKLAFSQINDWEKVVTKDIDEVEIKKAKKILYDIIKEMF